MFPAMCSSPPCMNIELKSVSSVGGWASAVRATPAWPSQAIEPAAVSPQWSPMWVSS